MNFEPAYQVIVNPNAGGGKAKMQWPSIEQELKNANIKFDSVLTKRRRHAMRLTKESLKNGYRNFIIVGGDGTINEVVNGIMTSEIPTEQITIGVIMIGTGNDWGKMFDIPFDYKNAIQIIKNRKTFRQDVGRVIYHLRDWKIQRYFINMAGLGFDARVAQSVNKDKDKGKSSQFSYLISLFKTLMKYKPMEIDLKIAGRPMAGSKLFTMSIGICKYSGGGMMQVPNAIADDGLFDVMIVSNIAKTKIIRNIKKLYDGTIESLSEVEMLRTHELKVNSRDMVMLEVDGESLGHGPFEFSIANQQLNIIVG